jgi:putative protein-disulfide isomerase
MFLSFNEKASGQKDTLYYIGDPMCSWCYGFSPELDKVKSALPQTHLKIILGGLRANGTETFKELREFLSKHWLEVNQITKQPFSYQILKDENLIYNTEPACRAIVVVRSLKPDAEYTYFKELQSAFYEKNQDPTSLKTFRELAVKFGIEESKFEKYFYSPVIINETERDFRFAHTLGIQGFPSLMVINDNKLYKISDGYVNADKIIHKLRDIGIQILD